MYSFVIVVIIAESVSAVGTTRNRLTEFSLETCTVINQTICAVSTPFRSFNVRILAQCLSECQHDDSDASSTCVGVNYREVNKMCDVYATCPTAFAVNIPGCQFIKKEAVEMISSCTSDEKIEQWVGGVDKFSTQWTASDSSANKVIGVPDVYPSYTNTKFAWAPLNLMAKDYLELSYSTIVNATEVHVYETHAAGAVVKASLFNLLTNSWVTVWQTPNPQFIANSRIFSVSMSAQSFPTKQLRLDIDGTASGNRRVNIDAAKLIGTLC